MRRKDWNRRGLKIGLGLAALLVLGVLASGAVADPSDPLGGAVSVLTGSSSADSTTSTDATSTGSSAPSTDTTTAPSTDSSSTATDTSPAASQYGTSSTDSTT